jgi:antitoxin component YwqK of YwqJK toxin-antitoxin module
MYTETRSQEGFMKQLGITLICLAIGWSSVSAWYDGRVDTVRTHYPDGTLEVEYQTFTYDGNERSYKHGYFRTYHPNGLVYCDGRYDFDAKFGCWLFYDTIGNRVREETYVDGVMHGPAIRYMSDGTLRLVAHYHNGEKHGLETVYKESTTPLSRMNHAGDLLFEGQYFWYYGNLLLPIKREEDKHGKEMLWGGKEPYYNDQLDLWVEWDSGNRLFFIGRKQDGEKTGRWTRLHANGSLHEIVEY